MGQEQAVEEFREWITARYPNQKEYLQATLELAKDVIPVVQSNSQYQQYDVLKRLCEPERIIHFSVTWLNDEGKVELNHGWRVQHSGLIGPYKGGLRFHPTVNESVLKFLAFEQSFKNALTGLPMGGAKGGSDFDPAGRSDGEIMRFCQTFMQELQRHIGPYTDVPAGDINVGSREIGFLYGAYRRLNNRFGGAITGKDIEFGGSHVRTEATGFGLIYFLKTLLDDRHDILENKKIAISGAGNVALHAALRAVEMGGCVQTLSNSRGCLVIEKGFEESDIRWAIENKPQCENVLTALEKKVGGEWLKEAKPWTQAVDIAMPCATQNELNEQDAQCLAKNGCQYVLEGANMPCTKEAKDVFHHQDIIFVPGKAANAGGVAVSGMEMGQNASFKRKSFNALDSALCQTMQHIYQLCEQEGTSGETINYARGANIAAFKRLADSMVAQGL